MRKRMVVMLVVVIAFLAIIGSVKYFQVRTAMAQQGSYQPPPEAVTTVIARPEQWNTTLSAIGTVVAVQGVTISADLPGVVQQIAFDSGSAVRRGDLLVRLDSRQELAQLASAESQRDLAALNLKRSEGLAAQKIIPQATFDQSAAEHRQAEARVAEIRATIQRKTIRAPFSGVIGIRQVNVGQYLAPGSAVASLQALQPVYVNFTVPQQEMSRLQRGASLEVKSDGFTGTETGRVSAYESLIDASTRNVQVQAIFDNKSGKLRPGMFVEAALARGGSTSAITIPTSAISYAPFGDSVFIVEQMKGPDGKMYRGVRQQFVKLGGARGDQVAVMDGVKPGEEVVTSGAFKLRNGAAVHVNNEVRPANAAAPTPADN